MTLDHGILRYLGIDRSTEVCVGILWQIQFLGTNAWTRAKLVGQDRSVETVLHAARILLKDWDERDGLAFVEKRIVRTNFVSCGIF